MYIQWGLSLILSLQLKLKGFSPSDITIFFCKYLYFD